MQGQRSTIGSLPDTINFDYGSPTANVGIDQQICWNSLRNPAESRLPDSSSNSDTIYMGSVSQDGRNMGRWNVGDSSSSNPQNLVGHDGHSTQSEWSPPINNSIGTGLRLDLQQHEPVNLVSQRYPAESRLPDSASNSDTIYMGSVSQVGHNMGRWNVGGSNSSNPQNLVGHDGDSTQSGWSPPINTSIGTGLRLDLQQHEPVNLVSQPVNLNLNNNQIAIGPSFVQGSSSSSASQNFDLNVARFHRFVDEMDCPNSSKSMGFKSIFPPSGGTSSDPFGSSSDSGGFLVEDEDGRPSCSLDGRRLSGKRKTLEGNGGESSNGGSCFPGEESSIWRAISPHCAMGSSVNTAPTPESSINASLPEQVNPRLGLGMGARVPGDNVRPLDVPAGLESTHRIYRSRANLPIQQDSVSNNSFLPVSNSVTRRPEIPSVHQPLRFVPIDPSLDLMSIPQDTLAPPNQSTVLRAPTMRRNVQLHRGNSLRPGNSSSTAGAERDDLFPIDSSSRNLHRNIGEHPMFAPQVESRNSGSHPIDWSLNSSRVGISRNAGSSSRSRSNAGSHSSAGPSWASHRHPPSQYSRRLSEYVRRSLMSTTGSDITGQSSSSSQHRSVPVSSQDGALPSSGGVPGQSRSHSRAALWMERQGDGTGGLPYLRALAAAGEGRSRLFSEIRNALDSFRRGEGLRIEDVMLLDQSVLFGVAGVPDQHRDMRLDVDNMSYEELLALEERIGYVCTGLSEEMILKCMKQRKHVHTMSDDLTEAEPCCVCQEHYMDGEDIGMLDCGHDFHRECIKQWLEQKNLCPICKTTGLATK